MPNTSQRIEVDHNCQYREQIGVISVGAVSVITITLLIATIDTVARNLKK